MANQAIALQARAPQQGNFLAPAIQQAGQIANRMAQQQALDRQTATAEQALRVSQAGEAREAAKAPFIQTKTEADATAAQMDRDSKAASVLKNDLGMVESGNINAAAAWRARAAQLLPDWAAYLPSAEKIAGDRQTQLMLAGTVEQIINKSIPTPSTVLNFAPGGRAFAITTGGVNAPRADEVTTGSMAGAPPVAPTPMTMPPAAGVQPMAAPQTPTGGMFQRMSATGGQPQGADPQAALLASLMQAKQTGQIGSDVVEQLRQLDPRITPNALDAILAQNGIKVAPGGGMRSAVYRPDGNAMAPQQIANRVGTQYIGRDPTESPLPGSAMVPLGRVAAEARAGRQTPQEAYDLELAKARAARDIGPKPLTPVQDAKLRANISKDFNAAQTTLDAMLNPVSGVMAAAEAVRNLSPEQKEAVTGYSGYVPSVTDSSKTADTKIKNLLGKVTELGKAQASMSGAIGAMAVQEWTIVRNMIANLDVNGMSARDLDNQIDIIVSAAQGAANRVRDQYLNQYAEEFDRYPKRFQLKDPQAAAKPAAGAGKIPRYNPASRSFE